MKALAQKALGLPSLCYMLIQTLYPLRDFKFWIQWPYEDNVVKIYAFAT